ncbi:hypothetical protein G3T14_16610 [Methylobacterium sp. BTF04]|uniref:hypothetical protein n=1 Tax=Methylobacterium sp. BTF04 TaxID=2708300 RepID=UPI0013D4334C|nr:hypothetical protein [Methylobacterium sp. BTF04]NEU13742.1 hypothetical protein [Methylobacterium sp. BTF04]
MRIVLSALVAIGTIAGPIAATASPGFTRQGPAIVDVESTSGIGGVGGRAPWNRAWEYDSGSGNDRRPELPYYQQGRGQQTGGPDRNLLPDDGLRIFPN